jgi:two-component system KDP operon response regulator KdpE
MAEKIQDSRYKQSDALRIRKRILVVDDDPLVTKLLSTTLLKNGYEVNTVTGGLQALEFIESEPPDLIILDILLPELSGYEVARKIRESSQVPIIILSGICSEIEKVRCLDLGADDYISKPFGPRELLARVHAVLRRAKSAEEQAAPSPSLKVGEIEIDFNQLKVTLRGVEVKLTPTEYALLRELAINSGKVLTYSYLLEHVWGPRYTNEKEYLHVFIGRLRAKLEKDKTNPRYILTASGIGYELKGPSNSNL